MSPFYKTAELCFSENIANFANATTQPEKYNLYNGLHAMAQSLSLILATVGKLEMQLNDLAKKMK